MTHSRILLAVFVLVSFLGGAGRAGAQDGPPAAPDAALGSGFSYQGVLSLGGQPVTATCEFQFSLYDALSSGAQVGITETVASVSVAAGHFTVLLNGAGEFGPTAFNGRARWLAVAVECPPDSSFTLLDPRQALTAVPYALALPGLYTQPNATSPNIIGGYSGNTVTGGAYGVVIAGGGASGSVNTAGNNYATVGGGLGNSAAGRPPYTAANYATIGGGAFNVASAAGATVAGGGFDGDHFGGNIAAGNASAIGGGISNTAGLYATVAGGISNTAADDSVVGGGDYNTAGSSATVAGGNINTASGNWSTVGGGVKNEAGGGWATVGGGAFNVASGDWATVGGGQTSIATGQYATVAGGYFNAASGSYATVGGGDYNTARAFEATVGGGGGGIGISRSSGNVASAPDATVGGGHTNTASGFYSTVGGGDTNTAIGQHATVPGGSGNLAKGDYSFAAGHNARAFGNGSFVWACGTCDVISDTLGDNFFAVAKGGIYLYTSVDNNPYLGSFYTGCYIPGGGGGWDCTSDRNAKTNFAAVDGLDVLNRLAGIPIESWNFKTQDAAIRHIGPMAQDFQAAFHVGEDDTSINTVDAQGVALAAIQGLYTVVQQKDAQITALQAEQANTNARLAALEQGRAPAATGNTLQLLMVLVLGLVAGGGLVMGAFALGRAKPTKANIVEHGVSR